MPEGLGATKGDEEMREMRKGDKEIGLGASKSKGANPTSEQWILMT